MKDNKGASKYGLSSSGYIYHLRKGKQLARFWSPSRGNYSVVQSDDGRRCRAYISDSGVEIVSDSTQTPDDLKTIPNYPNYAITPYGAVWRVSGIRNPRPHIVTEHLRGKSSYVQLRNKFGKRHNLKVDHLIDLVWPNA